MAREMKFESPTFSQRIGGMLGVDFYRLFHTPMFYIFLAIAAIIPAMASAMTMMPDQNGNTMEPLYSNVWQIIAASEPLYPPGNRSLLLTSACLWCIILSTE